MEFKNMITTMCRLCNEECGMNVFVQDGKIVGFEGLKDHPVNKGMLCPKGNAVIDYVYARERILHPLQRDGDSWKRIDWDEALRICVNQLKEIGEKYGPRSVAFMTGEAVGHSQSKWCLQRFADAYRSPNVFSVGSLCFHTRVIGHYLTLGQFSIPDFANSNCIVFWGSNPYNSRPVMRGILDRKKEKGAKFVTIDPLRHDLAKKSDLHLQIKPGTDCALALGVIHIILEESKYDKGFVNKFTNGFEELRKHVKEFTPQVVSKITGLPEEDVTKFSQVISSIKPMAIIAATGVDHVLCGTDTHRAICVIQALTGNVNIPGGYIFTSRLNLKNIRLMDRLKGEKPIGAKEYPFYWDIYHEGQGMLLFDAILREQPYPIKALFIQGMNPVLTWPNSKKTREALRKPFLVVADVFQTQTTELADLVLPAATTFETNQLRDYGNVGVPMVGMRQRASDPIPESMPSEVFWLELARAMGMEKIMPWENEIGMIKELIEPTGITFEELIYSSPGVIYEKNEGVKSTPTYKTPSGKIEFYSKQMRTRGLSALPTYIEPPQSTVDYPLVLCTGARKIEYQHSRFRNIKSLREKHPEPEAELSRSTAEKYGIFDRELVHIETEKGRIKIRAFITEDVRDDVVNCLHGWEGDGNVNELTDDERLDPVSGFPNLKSIPCRIVKV